MNDKLYLIKLDLFQHNLAEIKKEHGAHIGTIVADIEVLIDYIGSYTDAIRNYNDCGSSFALTRVEVCNFRYTFQRQKLNNLVSEGLVRMQRDPEQYEMSIAAYLLINLL